MADWKYRLLSLMWRVGKPLTLGVRAIVTRGEREVLLVRLTYLSGWFLPGGGVEKGETVFQALRRELREECGLEPLDLRLCHLYDSEREGKRDHIALFHVPAFTQAERVHPDGEIAEVRFFAWDSLPEEVTPATRRRIDESGRIHGGALVERPPATFVFCRNVVYSVVTTVQGQPTAHSEVKRT